jgi:hypothetical protein
MDGSTGRTIDEWLGFRASVDGDKNEQSSHICTDPRTLVGPNYSSAKKAQGNNNISMGRCIRAGVSVHEAPLTPGIGQAMSIRT